MYGYSFGLCLLAQNLAIRSQDLMTLDFRCRRPWACSCAGCHKQPWAASDWWRSSDSSLSSITRKSGRVQRQQQQAPWGPAGPAREQSTKAGRGGRRQVPGCLVARCRELSRL